MMTIAELLDIASNLTGNDHEELRHLGRAIIDLIGEARPCGWDAPRVRPLYTFGRPNGHKAVEIPEQWTGESLDPADARAMARMLLAAADEAEQSKVRP